jgi:hypothetical protein
MRKADVKSNGKYKAKVSNKVVTVQLLGEALYGNGYDAVNLETGRRIRIKSAAKLREEVRD